MVDRRHILRAGSMVLALCVAGRTAVGPAGDTSPEHTNAGAHFSSATPGDDDGEADQPATSTATDDSPLGRREANVTPVAVEDTDGRYRFDVTLYHVDDSEDGYANRWQVETIDRDPLGTLLERP